MTRRLWMIALVIVAGCERASVVPASGRVTLDSAPLADVFVAFEPIDGQPNPGMGSTGRTDADGRYVLRQTQPDRPGALVGNHRVRITTAPRAGAQEGRTVPERLPAIYNLKTTLNMEVPPQGSASLDFNLKSKSK